MTQTALPAAAPAPRIRATPYARRLARERNLPLSALTGSGPNGRVVGEDIKTYKPPEAPLLLAVAVQAPAISAAVQERAAASAPAVAAAPAAIAAGIDFSAAEALLEQIAKVKAGMAREDVCLKAAAVALTATSLDLEGTILLLAAPNECRRLPRLAGASLGAVSTVRQSAGKDGAARFAVSFLSRPGIRPVAAQLIGGADARLVIGAAGEDGRADCLLSYDPDRITDDAAAEYLSTFRDLVEVPFSLLV